MKRIAVPLAVALLLAAGTAHAEPAASSAATGEAAPAGPSAKPVNDKEDVGDSGRMICRNVEQIGTRFGAKKVCATASDWAVMRAQQREGAERVQTGRWKSD
ncbi:MULTISPECIES: hypothetical protein [Novosphingobium]|uniref:hypothetical protein n=1 Tax=Novosphingobium TaxID=165696 RepID=UPI001CD54949|nr:hypothetical protein [Novosphingobium percolationis]